MLISELPSALERFDDLERRLAGRRPAVFLDYDGTLTPIAARPEQAVLAAPVRAVLERLAALCPVALVSGRDLATLRRLVGVEGLTFAGEHGFDILHPDGSTAQPPEVAALVPHVEAAGAALEQGIGGIEGVLLERKRFSIAIHYRHVAPEAVQAVRDAVAAQLARHPQLKGLSGKKVLELQPALDWNKGRAIVALTEEEGIGAESLPIFLGDDTTDETAFEALAGRGVCIVLEGEEDRETAAGLRLGDPTEARRYLERLIGLLAQGR
ncbi:trehalose 6-phosphatase [Tistlia consotensis]|uniref:Trehalose 6-phosphate phosphatase n=1 Tax=Tistlia consotensis USBA 355 TaxID=560819 RepID=A0A1Y6BPX4_9PROT|nr:trehalose-phosphatase [Tistlia consotensis]SMF12216.1 trehalose 6-phosphatase [Tistlia consotensis USBA 355]SNR51269.1 trehalose 6-phosphatase [Tistlia consotensis]